MVTRQSTLVLFFFFFFLSLLMLASPSRPSLAPAFFVLGDSTIDCGNNNHLGSLANANHPPYGRDFDTHLPTGRFSNGRIIVDYLAERLGLPFIPPILGLVQSNRSAKMHGVNYASGGAGVLPDTGKDLGMCIPLSQQIEMLNTTFKQFVNDLGMKKAVDRIRRSVFYVSVGSNDFIHSYFRYPKMDPLVLPWDFTHNLASLLKERLKDLYSANVRKVVVMGLAPIGCAPYFLSSYDTKRGKCVDEINNVVLLFNSALRYMVNQLNHELPDVVMTFCDGFQGSMDILANHHVYGITTTSYACCGLGKHAGWSACLIPEMACNNASTHVWWDQFHPTELVNRILADNIWSGAHTKTCNPINLRNMVKPGH